MGSTKPNNVIKLISKLTAIQFVGGLILAIFLMAMKSSQIRLEAKVEILEKKIASLAEKSDLKSDQS